MLWFELANCNRRLLFGLFYRPPISKPEYFTGIENLIALAIDTGKSDMIITGEFYVLNELTARKIETICIQYSFFHAIRHSTSFTEHSAILICILLVNDKYHLLLRRVCDAFLIQELRYHCLVYGTFKFSKTKTHFFTRTNLKVRSR